MAAFYETLGEKLFPLRWWLLACVPVLPAAWMLGVRLLLTLPGFVSADTDWLLLKLTFLFGSVPWVLFLLAFLFDPRRGLLRVRGEAPSLALRALRLVVLIGMALALVAPVAPFLLPI